MLKVQLSQQRLDQTLRRRGVKINGSLKPSILHNVLDKSIGIIKYAYSRAD